jgi:hypothetical protein
MIASLQSFGDDPTRFHPHLHSLVTDGLVSPEGSFLPLPCLDPVQIMRLFRHRLLDALLAQDKIMPLAATSDCSKISLVVDPGFLGVVAYGP